MKDIKDRAREYLIKHSEYSEVFDQTFVAVDTLTAMVDFAEQENAELKAYNEKLLNGDIEKHNKIVELQEKISILLSCKNCSENKGGYIWYNDPQFLEGRQPVIFSDGRCPDCKGKLIDDDYDENIGKVVWTCKKCGKKWILY